MSIQRFADTTHGLKLEIWTVRGIHPIDIACLYLK